MSNADGEGNRDRVAELLEFERLLTDISSRLLELPSPEIKLELEDAVERVGQFLGMDSGTVFVFSEDGREATGFASWSQTDKFPPYTPVTQEQFPWCFEHFAQSELIILQKDRDLPPLASTDLASLDGIGFGTAIAMPFRVQDEAAGMIAYAGEGSDFPWSDDLLQRFQLVSRVFGNTYARYRAETAFRETEERFRVLFESAPDAYYITDLDGTFIDGNEAAELLIGMRKTELIGKSYFDMDFLAPQDLDRAREARNENAMGRPTPPMEHEVRRKDGSQFWMEVIARPVTLDGQLRVLYLARNVTRRKQSEARLREAQRLAHIGHWELDLIRNELTWSDEAYRIFGIAPDAFDATIEAFLETIHPEDRDRVATAYSKSVAEHTEYSIDHRTIRPDGEIRYVHERCGTHYDTSGTPLRSLGTVQDITERIEAEGELTKREARFRAIFEHSHDAIFLMDGDQWIECNAKAIEIYGCDSRDQIIGHSPLEFSPLTQPDGMATADKIALKTKLVLEGEPQSFQWKHLRLDGSEFDAEIGLTAVTLDGKRYVQAISRDITKRVEATRKLQESLESTIAALATTAEKRDPYTAGHQRRVTELACAIAEEMALPVEQIKGLRFAATMHDIGKMAIPSEILTKPGRLTDIEFQLIQQHSQMGYEILEGIRFPWPVAQIVIQHHERQDGSGYPAGVAGDEILLEARVLAVADVVEAMSTHRPYRPALGIEIALEEIQSKRGSHFDPEVVAACTQVIESGRFGFED